MKTWIMAGLLACAFASPVFANCGMCGQGTEAGAKETHAHEGAQCSMHGEKNGVLLEAATALETSHPELAAKLKGMAAHCCGEHS